MVDKPKLTDLLINPSSMSMTPLLIQMCLFR